MMNLFKSLFNDFIHCLLLGFLCINLYACQQTTGPSPSVVSGLTMGTTYTIKIYAPDLQLDHAMLSAGITERLDMVNQQMSTYLPTSDLSLFNQSTSPAWQEIPVQLYTVIEEALRIHQLSEGAFDITIGPVVDLWGFGPEARINKLPDAAIIHETLANVGSRYIHLRTQPYSIKKDKTDLRIDLSAIAKGFAVDVIANYLDELSIKNYMVEIGGEIKTRGHNPDNKIWQIGIEKPLTDQRAVETVISLDNQGMATSGDYRNYFEENGVRYSHTINPITGKPITHKLASVTVLHPSSMTADALATALLVLGSEQGFELAQRENLAVLFIVREGNSFIDIMTPHFRRALIESK